MNRDHLDWPFFDAAHRDARGGRRALERGRRPRSRARRSRCRLPPPRARPRGGRVAALLRARGVRRRAARARFARAVRRSRDAGAARRPRRFRLRDAGVGQRRHHAGRNRGAAGALAAGGRARRGDRRVRAVGAGRGIGRRGDDHARRPRRRRIGCSTAPRRGSPTAASPISIACSPAPARRRERAAYRPSSSLPPRRASRSPSGSRRSPRTRWLAWRSPVAVFPPTRCWARKGRASSSRCARSTSSARPSRRRRWASPAARWPKRRRARARGRCSAACWAICN